MKNDRDLWRAARTAILYFFVAAAWVLFSDRVLAGLTGTDKTFVDLQNLKGAGFVLVTALLLFVVLRRELSINSRSMRALHESEEKFRRLFEDIPLGLFRSTPDGRLLDINQTMIKMFGYENRDEMIGLNSHQLYLRPEDRQKWIQRANQHEVVRGYEVQFRRADGSLMWGRINARVLRQPDNTVATYEGVIEDITEQKQVEEALLRHLRHMSALRAVDKAINTHKDLPLVLEILGKQMIDHLGVDALTVSRYHAGSGQLELLLRRGFRDEAAERPSNQRGDGYAAQVAEYRQRIYHHDHKPIYMSGEAFHAYLGIPLLAKGQLKGVIEVLQRDPHDLDDDWLDFLETMVNQAVIAIENMDLYQGLQQSNVELTQAYDATLEGWARALELRDRETEGHSRRVTDLAVRLAEAMQMSPDDVVQVRRGALLHDIGKLGVPDYVLHKPGPLNDEEMDTMRLHPVYAYEMLSTIPNLCHAIDIPYCHHEHWDGNGYPRGLRGEAIPLSARIFAVIDVWDALLSDRPYRKAWSEAQVRDYLIERKGRQFDPAVVDTFLRLV